MYVDEYGCMFEYVSTYVCVCVNLDMNERGSNEQACVVLRPRRVIREKKMNRSVSHLTYIIQYHNNMLPYDINICLR